MKLKNDLISFLKRVIDAANLVGIESVLIERERIRAMEKGKNESVVIILDTNVPQLPFDAVGLTRLDVFANRLAVAESLENMSVDAVVDDSGQGSIVKSIAMTAKGFKVEYRCANPKAVKKAPKELNDVFKHRIKFGEDAVSMMTKGRSAMGADIVTLASNSNGVSFEFVDVNNDVFSFVFADDVESLTEDDDTSFVFRFPADMLLSMLKKNETGYFEVSQNGLLQCEVYGVNVIVMQKA